MLSFQSFRSSSKTLKWNEALNLIKKGQIKNLNYSGFVTLSMKHRLNHKTL